MKVMFKKTREVKTPFRANVNDAGIDFFLPEFDEKMVEDLKKKNTNECNHITIDIFKYPGNKGLIIIPPGNAALIPTGIHVAIEPKNSALIAYNKSGLASKKGIIVTAQVVDSDYTGEIHVGLLNTSSSYVRFNSGDKIGQFVHSPVYLTDFVEISEEYYREITSSSDRGTGGFGSTDTFGNSK